MSNGYPPGIPVWKSPPSVDAYDWLYTLFGTIDSIFVGALLLPKIWGLQAPRVPSEDTTATSRDGSSIRQHSPSPPQSPRGGQGRGSGMANGIKWSVTMYFILITLCHFPHTIFTFVRFVTYPNHPKFTDCGFTWILVSVTYGLSKVAMYLYFVSRVEEVFKGSIFAYSHNFLNAVRVVVLLVGLSWGISFSVSLAEVNGQCSIAFGLVLWGGLSDFVLANGCIGMFVVNLLKLSKTMSSDTMSHARRKLLVIAAKQSILTLLTVLSMGLFMCLGAFILTDMAPLFATLDGNTNTWCILLSFAYYDDWYKKVFGSANDYVVGFVTKRQEATESLKAEINQQVEAV